MPELGTLGTQVIGRTKEGRRIIRNPDGTVSTERVATVELDGQHFNIPTIFNGLEVTIEEALAILRKNRFIDPETKRRLRPFPTARAAESAAQKRSHGLDLEMRETGFIP